MTELEEVALFLEDVIGPHEPLDPPASRRGHDVDPQEVVPIGNVELQPIQASVKPSSNEKPSPNDSLVTGSKVRVAPRLK